LKRNYRIEKNAKLDALKNKATGIAQHIAYVIQNNTDVLILTICADLKMVAVYSVYHLVTYSLRSITISCTGGMEAVFGNMIVKGEQEELIATYRNYKFTLTVLTVVLFGAAALLILPFVKIYTNGVSDVDYIRPVFAALLLVADAINCLIWPCFNLTIAGNKLRESRIGAYGEAAINVGVSLALVFWNPLVGIAIGTLAAVLFKSIFYIVFSGKKVLCISVPRMIANAIVVSGILMAVSAIGMAVIQNFALNSYLLWIVAGFCTFTVVAVIALLSGLLLYPSIFQNMKNRFLKRQ